jgi:hypothetical protein
MLRTSSPVVGTSLPLVLLFAFCASLAAQESLSTIRGTVFDPSGAIVAGAVIAVDELNTNIRVRSVPSDNQGNFEMPGLKPGSYRLSATQPGFKKFVVDDIHLLSSQVRRVDVAFQVGEVEAQVTVSGEAAAIETEQGKVSAELSGARYKDLPLAGNRYSGTAPVLATLPHVQPVAGGGFSGAGFAGQVGTQLQMAMDGVKEETLNTQTVNLEAVEELKLVAVNNTAEYGRIGYFDTVSKRGANRFHGELSYYQQNSAFNARSFFERQKTRDLYHMFNVSASGPIFRDKTFFYALWNGERVPGQTFLTRTVPTEAMRRGDFSQLLNIARPVVIRDPLTNQPYPNNVIPSGSLNATSLNVQEKYLPTPNVGAIDNLVNNFSWVHTYPSDQFRADVLVGRVDHQISDKNSLYARLSTYLPRYILPGNYPATTPTSRRQSHSWVLGDTHVFSPNVVNTFTFGGNRNGRDVGIEINGYKPPSGTEVVQELGLTGLTPELAQLADKGAGFPTMNITGFTAITLSPGGRADPWNFSYADALTWSTPKHVLKFGGELRTYSDYNGLVPAGTYGEFTFNGSLTGNAYADFLLGLPYSSNRLLEPLLDRTRRSKEIGLFITDTFKVTSRLNVDYGLRWDYFTSTTYDDGLMYNWDPATGNVIVPAGVRDRVSRLYPSNINLVTGDVIPTADKTNFAPRIGAAYRFSDRTVLRGAYGIFNEFFGSYARALGGGPFQISETYFNSIQNGQPLFRFPNPFPAGAATASIASQSVSGYPMETKNGYIHQFNVTVERQIGDIGLRMSYVGSRNVGFNYDLNINKPMASLVRFSQDRRPYPQFVGASFAQENGESKYNSLTFEAKRRVGSFTFDAFWTWAHNMSNYLNLQDPYNPNLWNRDATTPRHRVVINSLWEVPVGRGKRFLPSMPGAVDHVLGGWKLAWLAIFQTGQFFTPSFSGSDPSNTNTSGGLPDRVCNGNLPAGERTLGRWFDVSCFAVPTAGRFGNSGVNVLEGPGVHTHGISLTKRFILTERLRLDFLSMMSNVFNHPNFANPGSNISAPAQAGVITGQHGRFSADRSGPRFIDMRVRLEF